MSLTRRRFIGTASLSALASAAFPTVLAQTIAPRKDDPFKQQNLDVLANASEETFKPYIGESFAMVQGGRRLASLTLLAVTPAAPPPSASKSSAAGSPPRRSGQTVRSFSLSFQGSGASEPQGTYTLNKNSLGSFSLFLVPGGPGKSPQTYTAVFSLLVP
ncbi:MAG: hypothetical protein P4L26_17780 [Terracidiphilus sp.]|jgi:hypothetical protein|nr:hypothetical protein [Terracidiphilus sp.]